jgi:hypothetical protein
MKKYKWKFEAALEFARSKRACVSPNHGFTEFLLEFEVNN